MKNFRIASLLLAITTATATGNTYSKAYRIFNDPPRPKARKASPSVSASASEEESFIATKSSKILLSISSSLSIPSKSSKSIILPSFLSIPFNSAKLSIPSKSAKSKTKTDMSTADIMELFDDIDITTMYSSKSKGAKSKKSNSGVETNSAKSKAGAETKASKVKSKSQAKVAKSYFSFSIPSNSPTFVPTNKVSVSSFQCDCAAKVRCI